MTSCAVGALMLGDLIKELAPMTLNYRGSWRRQPFRLDPGVGIWGGFPIPDDRWRTSDAGQASRARIRKVVGPSTP